MSQATASFRHPLLRAVDGVAELLDSVADAQPTYLSEDEKEELLVGLQTQAGRIESLRALALAAADDVALEHGARNAGAWLAHRVRQDGPVGRRWLRLADGLDQRWLALAEAYAAGTVSTEQVQVVGRALDDLPPDLDADLRVKAEEHLVEQAAHFTPRELRVLGRRVLEVIAPDVAEAPEVEPCTHLTGG